MASSSKRWLPRLNRRQFTVAGLMALGGGRGLRRVQADAELAELREAATQLPAERRAGLPLFPGDLQSAAVSADQNAAPLYRALGQEYRRLAGPDREARDSAVRSVIAGTTAAEARALAAETLVAWAPLIQIAREAARRPRCDFGLDWQNAPAMEFPPSAEQRHAVRLLAAAAAVAIQNGDLEATFSNLADAGRLLRHFDDSPMAVMLLVAVSVAETVETVFQRALKRHAGDREWLERATEVSRELPPAPDLRRHLRGELLFMAVGSRRPKCFIDPEEEFDPRDEEEKRLDQRLRRYPEDLLRSAVEARVLSFFRRLLAAIAGNPPEIFEVHRSMEQVCDAEAARDAPSYRLTRSSAGIYPGCALAAGRYVARQRIRDVCLGILKQRLRTGVFPDSLASPPADPFDGRPLRYRKTDRGFVLYSIGPNLKDDGGDPTRDQGGPRDIVFSYP